MVSAIALRLLGSDLLPLESLRSEASAAAGDGTVDMFARMMEHVRSRARIFSWLFAGMVAMTLVGRSQIESYVVRLMESLGPTAENVRRSLRALCSSRRYLLTLALITVVGAAIRAEYLSLPVFTDEAQTFSKSVLQPFYVGLSYYSTPNNHLLNTLLGHVSYVVFGNEPWLLRIPSFTAGVLTIPAAYLVFARHFDRQVGIVAAALTAVSVPLVMYGSQARGYSFVVLLFLVALLLATWIIEFGSSPALWMVFAGISALGAYAMPLMLYPFVICLAWVSASQVADSRTVLWADVVAAIMVTGILTFYLYLPVLLVSGPAALIPEQV